MDFSKLSLGKRFEPQPERIQEQVRKPGKKKVSCDMKESTTEHFLDIRRQAERLKMYENHKHDWRQQLQEEHPYVDVMPMQTKDPKELLKKALKKKKDEEASI